MPYLHTITQRAEMLTLPAFHPTDTGLLVFASIACAIFGGGAWGVACTMEERAPEHGNPPPVPSMLNCLRNPVFRALLLNRLIESVGMETQFTVRGRECGGH